MSLYTSVASFEDRQAADEQIDENPTQLGSERTHSKADVQKGIWPIFKGTSSLPTYLCRESIEI